MSICEIERMLNGYFEKMRAEWERARFIGTCFVGGKPVDLIRFPWDDQEIKKGKITYYGKANAIPKT